MSLGFSTDLRNARAQSIIDRLDDGAGSPGYIEFYAGTRPTTGAAVTSQTLMGTIVLGLPSGTVANGVMTLTSTTDDLSVDADGTISWARMYNGNDEFVIDGSCGLAGSGSDFILNTVTAQAGGFLSVNNGTITEGGA